MRLNSIMALIAVMCIAGVMSSELLGPMSRLRAWTHEVPGANQARFIRAGLAGDAFQFSPPLLKPPPEPPPGPQPAAPPPHFDAPTPVGSSVLIFTDGDGDDDNAPTYAFTSESVSTGLGNAVTFPTTQPDTSSTPEDLAVGPTPVEIASVPEPASWLTMVVGVGWIGLALRRRRSAAHRSLAAANGLNRS